jgi:hypothetical protein
MTRTSFWKRSLSVLVAVVMLVGYVPTALAAEALYGDRYLISETAYPLASGITEYVTTTNNSSGSAQNIDYFAEVDLNNPDVLIMASYADYDASKWKMQNVMDQASAAQAAFDARGLGYKVVGIVNGDFYNMTTGEPTGALVMEGEIYHQANGRNYFAILKDGTAVIRNSSDLSDVETAVGGDQVILRDGVVTVNHSDYADVTISRTAIGITADNKVITMACHGKNWPISCGFTYEDVAEMLKARGCVDALMLDCSGSTTYASLRAGDSENILRNSPSDGSARHVSSCLLLVTKAASDGVFDTAVISPVNEVYTPGSEISFSYIPVDSSNTPVDSSAVPELTWKLSEGSAGSIDAQTGDYTADASQTGEVTVQLVDSEGAVRGESTVLIEVPDSITFSSETASIGFGDTSNLGLTVQYQGRNVNYKDGDFTWDIQPTEYVRKQKISDGAYQTVTETDPAKMQYLNLGTVSDNMLTCLLEYTEGTDETERRASTATAEVTVTSVYDSAVSGTVTVEAGKEPSVIMNFEDVDNGDGTVTDAHAFWTIGEKGDDSGSYLVTSNYSKGGTVGAEIVSRADGYPVRSGSYSLKLDYTFNSTAYAEGVGGTEGACFGFRDALEIEGNPTALGVWVYIPEGTPNYWLRMQYTDGSGRTTQLDFTKQYKDAMAQDGNVGGVAPYADNTWHYFEADLTGLQAPLSIPAGMIGRLMVVPTESNYCGKYLIDGTEVPVAEREGSIYFDDIMFIYGSNPNDTNPPSVDSFTLNEENVSDGMVLTTNEIDLYATYSDGNTLQDTGIDFNNVFFYVDGKLLENATVDQGAGYIRYDSLILADGHHTVKVLVTDNNGNESAEEYTVMVQGNMASAVTVIGPESVTLGGTAEIQLVSSCADDIDSIELSLSINRAYRNQFTVTPGTGFELSGEATYDPVHSAIDMKLVRSGVSTLAEGDTTIATIFFNIPTDLQAGTGFSYGVDTGIVTYSEQSQRTDNGVFGCLESRQDVSVQYTISSDIFVAGSTETSYFYIKDESGNGVNGVTLSVVGGNPIGTSDEQGRVSYTPTQTGTISVQASGTFAFTTNIYAPQGDENGTPEMILHSAVGDLNTQRTVTWISNPLSSSAAAKMMLSASEDMSGAVTYSGTSELLAFNSDKAAVRANAVTASDLQPGQTYYYQVGDGTKWSGVSSFTMPDEGSTLKKILLMADIQDPENTTADAILCSLTMSDYALLIQTGDLVDDGGSYQDRKTGYEQLAKAGDINRIYAVGNHEAYGDTGLVNSHTLYQTSDDGYYTVTLDNLYIAVMDYGADYETALQEIAADAAESGAAHKILVTHQPAYYTNSAGGNSDMHAILPEYAEEAGFDMVFSGHDHSYARTKPLTGGQVDEKNGVIYVISGSVGEKGYPISPNLPFADVFETVTDTFDAAYLEITVSSDSISVAAKNFANSMSTVIDTFGVTCAHETLEYDMSAGKLRCTDCGTTVEGSYTGFYDVYGDSQHQVYLYLGQLQTGWFVYNSDYLHAGNDGILHEVEQYSTVTCTEHGYRGGKCLTCGSSYQGAQLNPTGHTWDENYKCTVCGFEGIDIASLEITLSSDTWSWNGSARRPVVTIKDGDKVLTRAVSIGSGIGEYYLTYPAEGEVGTVYLEIKGMLDYYGEIVVPYSIVPPNVTGLKAENVTGSGVTLTWDESHGATYYRVSLYDETDDTFYFRWTTEEPRLVLNDLEGGESYTFRVRAYAEIDGTLYTARGSSDELEVTIPTSDPCAEGGHQFTEEQIPASCENPGTIKHTCSLCGYSYTEIIADAIGHTVVTIPAVEPTCTEAGSTEGSYCSVCQQVLEQVEEIAPLGHNLAEYVWQDENSHIGVCSRCSQQIAEPHVWDEGEIITQPTVSAEGSIKYVCTVCGGEKIDAVPKLPSGGGGGSTSSTYAITVQKSANGTVTASKARAEEGDSITLTVSADEGYVLDTLTVTDKSGDKISLTEKNGKYTFEMPASAVTVQAVFREESAVEALPFTDVSENDWYYDAVAYAYENGLMEGTGYTTFAPSMTTTRSMLATLLYRLEDEPTVSGAAGFTDVPAGTWYTDAVTWAASEGIVKGVGDGTSFAPNNTITREQMAVMLYRYAQCKGYSVSQVSMVAHEYTDYGQVSDWAQYAMDWAVATGLITGTSDTTLSPQGQATRAEIATIFMRFCENVVK